MVVVLPVVCSTLLLLSLLSL